MPRELGTFSLQIGNEKIIHQRTIVSGKQIFKG